MANEQLVGAGEGGISGAAAGAQVGGGPGAAVGGVLGATLGYLGAGGAKGPQYDPAWFSNRESEINDYSNSLDMARSSYLASLGNMYNDAYSRFSQNAAPQFAAAGNQINSGAFAQSLAYKSAEYSANLAPVAYNAQREDLNNVNKARGDAFTAMLKARTGGADLGFDADQKNSAAMGGLFTNSLLAYGRSKAGNNGGYPSGQAPMYNPATGGWGTAPSGSAAMNNYGLGLSWNGGNPAQG